MRPSLKTDYFDWLYSLVFRVRDMESEISFVTVCDHLHSIQFNDVVPNDDNRTAYGLLLRDEFAGLHRLTKAGYDELWSLGPKATLFEMLIGLARQADFMVTVGLEIWFREFLENLDLLKFSDARFREQDTVKIMRILRTFNDRRYRSNGKGGIFPLKLPNQDQRPVELWYQMAAYMAENTMY